LGNKKKKRNHFKNKKSRHHILPSSRGGKNDDNIVTWDMLFHRYWHELFNNLTMDEIHEFIDLITKPNMAWTSQELARLREKIRCG